MIVVCVCRMSTHRQMQIGAKKLEQHKHTKMNTHTVLRALSALPSETTEPPLQVHGGRESLICHTHRNTHAASFPDTLSQQQKDGKRKESVLSEINREIIP